MSRPRGERIKRSVEEHIRNKFYDIIEDALNNCGEDYEVLRVPVTTESNSPAYRIAIPTCDEERNDVTTLITVSIVRPNVKKPEDYDCYDEHQRWLDNCSRNKKV